MGSASKLNVIVIVNCNSGNDDNVFLNLAISTTNSKKNLLIYRYFICIHDNNVVLIKKKKKTTMSF